MANTVQLAEYLANIKALLRLDPNRWRIVVEKQVQAHVLPHIAGTRAQLEPRLWELLIFCLDGHEASVPEMTEQRWEAAVAAARESRMLVGRERAVFPRAAIETALVLAGIREVGVYPPPKLGGQKDAESR
jgi:hypothetical protein